MKNKKTIKKIIIGLFVALLGLIVYAFINQDLVETDDVQGSLSSLIANEGVQEVDDSGVQLANQEILSILGSINNIVLDDSIFQNPVFRDLRDTRFTITRPIRIGRPNPFLPIGFDNVSQLPQDNLNQNANAQNNQNGNAIPLGQGQEGTTEANDDEVTNFFGNASELQ